MNQTWLTTFCELVEVGHFTKTAEKLFMTQSGVSQHIKKLENELGVSLLIRTGKSFSLTAQGHELYVSGKQILRSMRELTSRIKDDDPTTGIVEVMSPGSVGLALYTEILKLQSGYPELIMDYRFAPNDQIKVALEEREIEFGILTRHIESTKLDLIEIGREELLLVLPKGKTVKSWDDLITLSFIDHPDAAHHAKLLLSKNFETFNSIEQFKKGGFSNQVGLILEPVAMGLGFTVLPRFAVEAFTRPGEIHIQTLTSAVFETIYIGLNRDVVQSKRSLFVQDKIKEVLSKH